jgi:polyisoprenoid-binding protein YceI
MSTIEQTEQSVPTGTWNADTVHSSVGFEVPYAVGTFSGEVREFSAALTDGHLAGSAKIAEIGFDGDVTRSGDEVTIEGQVTIKGISQPATLTGTIVGPAVDHFGATRVGLKLETTVDRTRFGITWNMPLPSGEPALANEVTLKADLTLVQA